MLPWIMSSEWRYFNPLAAPASFTDVSGSENQGTNRNQAYEMEAVELGMF